MDIIWTAIWVMVIVIVVIGCFFLGVLAAGVVDCRDKAAFRIAVQGEEYYCERYDFVCQDEEGCTELVLWGCCGVASDPLVIDTRERGNR